MSPRRFCNKIVMPSVLLPMITRIRFSKLLNLVVSRFFTCPFCFYWWCISVTLPILAVFRVAYTSWVLFFEILGCTFLPSTLQLLSCFSSTYKVITLVIYDTYYNIIGFWLVPSVVLTSTSLFILLNCEEGQGGSVPYSYANELDEKCLGKQIMTNA